MRVNAPRLPTAVLCNQASCTSESHAGKYTRIFTFVRAYYFGLANSLAKENSSNGTELFIFLGAGAGKQTSFLTGRPLTWQVTSGVPLESIASLTQRKRR
jgi:hypothetical protein